jgi:hypothetical protein
MLALSASGISVTFDPVGGFLRDLAITDGGHKLAPLHTAPWVSAGEPTNGLPVHLARLAGDFFCAPFAAEEGTSTMHGWPANGHWTVQQSPTFRALLDHPVQGATLVKEVTLRDGHPFLYQRHIFLGGEGDVSVANHAMIALPHGGTLRFSPKRWFETSHGPQETDPARGRSALLSPARSLDPARFPRADGTNADLTRYPWTQRTGGKGYEDFVTGVEAPGHTFGWTAVSRHGMGDLYLSLRHAQRLPMTMLWHSDAGRDYAPWNGRHTGVLGVEEGAAPRLLGVGSTESPDPLSAAGQETGVTLAPFATSEVRHVTGCIAWPEGEPVLAVTLGAGTLTVRGESGTVRSVPFATDFIV